MINELNKNISFEVGHNEFSDWTKEELKMLSGFTLLDEDEVKSEE